MLPAILLSLSLLPDSSGLTKIYYVDFEFETFSPVTRRSIKQQFVQLSKNELIRVMETVFDDSFHTRAKDKFEEPRVRLCFQMKQGPVFVDKLGHVSFGNKNWKMTAASVQKLRQILAKYPVEIDLSVPY